MDLSFKRPQMSEFTGVVLTTSYFPPTSYFAAIVGTDRFYLEACENFQRQTYRNRCTLVMANGVESLTVPVEHGVRIKTPIREVRIAYHTKWQNQHFRAIESAYRRSPFYEFYIDDLKSFFTEKPTYLYDLNLRILHKIGELIDLDKPFTDTVGYESVLTPDRLDGRPLSHPLKISHEAPLWSSLQPYEQVFSMKHGFQANMSILDALFNLGPGTKQYLVEGIRLRFAHL